MKKKLLTLFSAIFALIVLISCGDDKKPQEQLATPVISLTGNIVSWDAVANAESYVVTKNNVAQAEQTSTTYTISDVNAGNYVITVIAKGTGYKDSNASTSVTYIKEAVPLTAPVISKIDNIVSWNIISGAKGYIVSINGNAQAEQTTLSYTVSNETPGNYVITVVAVSANTLINTNSAASNSVTITVEKAIESIEIATNPTTLSYIEGQTFDPTGLVVKAIYNDGTKEVIPMDDLSFNLTTLAITDTKVVVTYNGMTANIAITVMAKIVESIEVVTNPTKTTYAEGQTFDPTGLVVKAIYNDGSEDTIEIDDLSFDLTTLATTDTKVVVTYNGKTANIDITVVDELYVNNMEELQAAIDLRVAKIILNADIISSVQTTIPEGYVVTLDLNGHSLITYPSQAQIEAETKASLYTICNYGNLTIDDTSSAKSGVMYNVYNLVSASDVIRNYGNLVINGGTFGHDGDNAIGGVDNLNVGTRGAAVNNLGTATINGGEFKGGYYTTLGYSYVLRNGAADYSNAVMTINDALISGKYHGAINADYGTINVYGGTYELGAATDSKSFYVFYIEKGTINVYDGTFTKMAGSASHTSYIAFEDGKLNIYGGTYVNNLTNGKFTNYPSGVSTNTISISGGTFNGSDTVIANLLNYLTEGNEAIINVASYTQLESAVLYANEINLVNDINIPANKTLVISRNLVLDLGGYTIYADANATVSRAIQITNVSLNIVVDIKNGTIDCPSSDNTSKGVYGAILVENGTANLTNLLLTNNREYGLCVKVTGGYAYLENVEINSMYGGGLEAAGGEAYLKDCTFTQTGLGASGKQHCSTNVAASYNGKVTIESGNYTSENYGVYVYTSGGTIDILGGTYITTSETLALFVAQIDLSSYPNATSIINVYLEDVEIIYNVLASTSGKEQSRVIFHVSTVEQLSSIIENNNTYVKLNNDIIISETISLEITGKTTLDLNGYDITSTASFTSGLFVLSIDSKFTVVGQGKIELTNTNENTAIFYITKKAELIINSTAIFTSPKVIYAKPDSDVEAKITIDGATFNGKKGIESNNRVSITIENIITNTTIYAISVSNTYATAANLTIEDGTFNGTSNSASCAIIVIANNYVVRINGGNYNFTNSYNVAYSPITATTTSYASIIKVADTQSASDVIIAGGTYSLNENGGTGAAIIGYTTSKLSKFVITGGTFHAYDNESCILYVTAANNPASANKYTIEVNGGIFIGDYLIATHKFTSQATISFGPNADLVNSNNTLIRNETTYATGQINVYAGTENNLIYAPKGSNVMLVNDITKSGTIETLYGYNLDLNGYTITASKFIMNAGDLTEIQIGKNIGELGDTARGLLNCNIDINANNAAINFYANITSFKDLTYITNSGTLYFNGDFYSTTEYNGGWINITGGQLIIEETVSRQNYYLHIYIEEVSTSTGIKITLLENASVYDISIANAYYDITIINEGIIDAIYDYSKTVDIEIINSGLLHSVTYSKNICVYQEAITINDIINVLDSGAMNIEITLMNDIITPSQIDINEGTNVLIDLNGYTLVTYQTKYTTYSESYATIYSIKNIGTLTINDSSTLKTGKMYNVSNAGSGFGVIQNFGTLTINGGTFGNGGQVSIGTLDNLNVGTWGPALHNLGTATINNGSFTACDNGTTVLGTLTPYSYAIINGHPSYKTATLTINNANVYGNMNGAIYNTYGTININDITIDLGSEGNTWTHYALCIENGVINVYNGNFIKIGNNKSMTYFFNSNGEINIYDGYFNHNVTNSSFVTYGSGVTPKLNIIGGTFEGSNAYIENLIKYLKDGNKAIINVSTYEQLVSAISSANEIHLVANIVSDTIITISEESNIILDLNGYKLSGTSSLTPSYNAAIINNGTLVILDSSELKTGTIENQYGASLINNASMTINGGNYTIGNTTYYVFATLNKDAITTINNANVYGKIGGIIQNYLGTTIVNDGTFELGTDSNYYIIYAQPGTVIINGGTYINNGKSKYLFYINTNYSQNYNAVTITLNGGEFITNNTNYFAIFQDSYIPVKSQIYISENALFSNTNSSFDTDLLKYTNLDIIKADIITYLSTYIDNSSYDEIGKEDLDIVLTNGNALINNSNDFLEIKEIVDSIILELKKVSPYGLVAYRAQVIAELQALIDENDYYNKSSTTRHITNKVNTYVTELGTYSIASAPSRAIIDLIVLAKKEQLALIQTMKEIDGEELYAAKVSAWTELNAYVTNNNSTDNPLDLNKINVLLEEFYYDFYNKTKTIEEINTEKDRLLNEFALSIREPKAWYSYMTQGENYTFYSFEELYEFIEDLKAENVLTYDDYFTYNPYTNKDSYGLTNIFIQIDNITELSDLNDLIDEQIYNLFEILEVNYNLFFE